MIAHERKEEKRKMNKKLVLLLVPLLILPMISLGYAAWRDKVTKQYKFRFGTVEVEIVKWHVDNLQGWDQDCDGDLLGDEVTVEEVWVGTLLKGLRVKADPVGPGFSIKISMLVHNIGRLPILAEAPERNVTELFDKDPCWDKPKPILARDPAWLKYVSQYYRHRDWATHGGKKDFNASHYTAPVAPTGHTYQPCESVLVTQEITLDVQPYPELQCHWFRIDVDIPFKNSTPETDQSLHGPDGTDWP
jgi:hypothetical protein